MRVCGEDSASAKHPLPIEWTKLIDKRGIVENSDEQTILDSNSELF